MASTLIAGGTVVRPFEAPALGDLVIKDGKVVDVLPPGTGPVADRRIDATGKHVLPGVVDPHLHVGFGHGDDDWSTETRSAAAGGVTSVFTFLMAGTDYWPLIESTRAVADATSLVDYGLHVVPCVPGHLTQIEAYARDGNVPSFKYFTSFRGQEGAYLGVTGTDDGYLYAYLEEVAKVPGGIACIHSENIEVVWHLKKRLTELGRDDLKAWDEARPPVVEAEAASRAMMFASVTGTPIYLVHLSSRMALDEVRSWRERHPEAVVYVETCPHFLTHTHDSPLGALGKINPPLRSADDVEAVWAAVIDGTVDTIGSDHVPRRREKKSGSIWTASAGFPGTAAILPVMLSEGYHRRGMDLTRIVELTAANPARIMGCYPAKGSLAPGSDADVVIVDLDREQPVDDETFQSYADYSLYDGWTMRGWPMLTMVRGEVVMEDGVVVGKPGHGQFVPRHTGGVEATEVIA